MAGRDFFKIDWKEDITERMSEPWVKLAHDGYGYTPEQFITGKHNYLTLLWKEMEAQNQKFETFFDFMLKRFEWCKSGSAMGAKGVINISD